VVAFLGGGATAAAQALPPDFRADVIAEGFSNPVQVVFLPGGEMLVVEQGGVVWVMQDGARLPTPFADLSDEALATGDRGLLGVAVSPDFAATGEVVFLLTVQDPPGPGDNDYESAAWSRLVRYDADLAAGGLTIDPSTRAVLLGTDATDGIPSCSPSHSIGTVRYALDGTLFVGAGDGADFRFVDGGQIGNPVGPTCADLFPTQNEGALRAQDLGTLAGKLLRLDPATGGGLADNPFFDGDPTSVVSRVWALGLRNPYRFSVRPGGTGAGVVYAGDVGWDTWEEVDVAGPAGGRNFGWPCFEGDGVNGGYAADPATSGVCATVGAAQVTAPLLTWHHDDPGTLGWTGTAAIGGVFYEGTSYPAEYLDAYFFADYTSGIMKVLQVDGGDALLDVLDFGANLGAVVDVEAEPASGDLVYVSIGDGNVRRIVYDNPSPPPPPPPPEGPHCACRVAGGARDAATTPAGDAATGVAGMGTGLGVLGLLSIFLRARVRGRRRVARPLLRAQGGRTWKS
jgi:glucose/arabinose dehydrogenase